ncbi:HxlR family transcriptional regulator [Dokdonia sp. Hel_I_63]|uniref:winged helix-turn-helix transcriptional regulator n=1 Tax=Dokdonia sp. Hel_I_63 TaxID=1249996 RepID=UPI001199B823|nr:helix-turn-helix domain-containing protein [Dokdonia sp. Hel_I_63]TVZ22665.1 HxlR family transcriptional regulator [Dokdonia sp. Hel_I_63]
MKHTFRCDCPITSALDILGDKWMLVIIKQMLVEHKQTFKDFIESDEAIATNILTIKLKLLEELEIVTKSKLPNNKKTNLYQLTERGLSLATIIVDLALWSDANLSELNIDMRNPNELELMKNNKADFIKVLRENYRKKLATIE